MKVSAAGRMGPSRSETNIIRGWDSGPVEGLETEENPFASRSLRSVVQLYTH